MIDVTATGTGFYAVASREDEQTDLEALLASQGWQYFLTEAQKQWDTGFIVKVAGVISDVDDDRALDRIRQVFIAKREIDRLLHWPQERVQYLKRIDAVKVAQSSTAKVDPSRRGGL